MKKTTKKMTKKKFMEWLEFCYNNYTVVQEKVDRVIFESKNKKDYVEPAGFKSFYLEPIRKELEYQAIGEKLLMIDEFERSVKSMTHEDCVKILESYLNDPFIHQKVNEYIENKKPNEKYKNGRKE
jgi:hypothetical protein